MTEDINYYGLSFEQTHEVFDFHEYFKPSFEIEGQWPQRDEIGYSFINILLR